MDPVGEIRLPDKTIVDLAFQYLDDDQLLHLSMELNDRLVDVKAAYVIPGRTFNCKGTNRRVAGDDPPCGDGTRQIDADALAGVVAVTLLGMGADALGLGGVGTFIAILIDRYILSANDYQKEASCTTYVNLIPAQLDPKWVREHVTVSYVLSDWEGTRPVSPGRLSWANLDPAEVSDKSPYVEVFDNKGGGAARHPETDGRCVMTVMGGLFRNWSKEHGRDLTVTLTIDGFPAGTHSCADYSIVNRSLYDHLIVECLDRDIIASLIRSYADGIRDGAGNP